MTLSFLRNSRGAADEQDVMRISASMKQIGRASKLIVKYDQESSIKTFVDKLVERRRANGD